MNQDQGAHLDFSQLTTIGLRGTKRLLGDSCGTECGSNGNIKLSSPEVKHMAD